MSAYVMCSMNGSALSERLGLEPATELRMLVPEMLGRR
jgi:hypothetical protein